MLDYITRPGTNYPLGATYDGTGVNFALFSEIAEKVELCLFDAIGNESRIKVIERNNFIWHVYVEGIAPGTEYGYRVYGSFEPENGLRCNPNKLLLDPYAKAMSGMIQEHQSLYTYYWDKKRYEKPNNLDSKDYTMKSVVVSPYFEWGQDHLPKIPYSQTIIYEAHVKGMTKLLQDVPTQRQGTYLGLTHPKVLKYLKSLGITTLELMPIQQFINDPVLQSKGLNNYWGYNTIGFFAPHNGYAAGGDKGQQVNEFKMLVKCMHEQGIEVILDVVYNHTAEGNHLGPTLSFKGIDNKAYYRLVDGDEQHYFDTTGTGNSLLMRSPQALQLVMDSLRYWNQEMHVDGFRFDLAATLARQFHEVDKLSAFFDIIHQDPIISQVKLIAEPWDLGDGGYQVGGFPNLWSEWNGRYRDSVRDFWRSQDGSLQEFATRISGSSDLYAHNGRKPVASVNFITAHDGFTLADLVSYNEKHNQANGENNLDGENFNRSWNCGVEGETDDEMINQLRSRQQKNFFTTLLLSQGIPMILHGDELGRTQRGNNNTYCQDNKLSWMQYPLSLDLLIDTMNDTTESNVSPELIDNPDVQLLQFVQSLIALRKSHPVFHRHNFFKGNGDALWFDNSGRIMEGSEWAKYYAKTVMLFLDGSKLEERYATGESVVDNSYLIIFNGHYEEMEFTLPNSDYASSWELIIDTMFDEGFISEDSRYPTLPSNPIIIEQRSLRVYQAI